jgi:trehalose 6-phosphate phosphatase
MHPSEIAANPERWALFLDVDGTVLDVAATPNDVIVEVNLIENLARVEMLLSGALAFVSGRTIAVLDRLFAPLKLAAAGEHGAELRSSPGQAVSRYTTRPLDPALTAALAQLVAEHPALLLEEKPSSVVIHYRRAPELGSSVEQRIRALLDVAGPGLGLYSGKMSWDIREGVCTKGTAVRQLMAVDRFAGRTPVYLGDDLTDEDGFAEAERQGGVALAVAGEYRTPRPIAFLAPENVRDWLRQLAARQEAAA